MGQLHIVLFPAMAHGHMIPMLDMAKLFASRGVHTTIIATPAFADPIRRARDSGHDIALIVTKFPPQGSSLPDHIVSLDQMTSPDIVRNFVRALELLRGPTEAVLQELRPDCLISDMFLPWTAGAAAKFGIPRVVFYGTSCFARSVMEQMEMHKPYDDVASDSEAFVVPNLPHQPAFVRTQVSQYEMRNEANEFNELIEQMDEANKVTYGEVFNSFYGLESGYADHFENVLGRRRWHIGPLLLWNKKDQEKTHVDEHECLAWLDSRRPESVVYVCFGSMVTFTPAQLRETAAGLESSGQDFVWVVRKGKNVNQDEDWLPEGFEERVKRKRDDYKGVGPPSGDS